MVMITITAITLAVDTTVVDAQHADDEHDQELQPEHPRDTPAKATHTECDCV